LHRFKSPPEQWANYLRQLIQKHGITAIVVFGQGRYYHQKAIEVAHSLSVKVTVMEEGYFRPGYVTLEANGVNAFSSAMEEVKDVQSQPKLIKVPQPESTLFAFQKMCLHACFHYTAMFLGARFYPYYRHHKPTSLVYYVGFWLRSWLRKIICYQSDRRLLQLLIGKNTPYFFVPLQTEGDSQIEMHSQFDSIVQFIEDVIHSFAAHAPPSAHLVFKQHPMSRGGLLYGPGIQKLAQTLGLQQRVHFVLEAHNPTAIQSAQGLVIINSTMGLKAIARGKPVKVLGQAFFDRPGLTDPQHLDDYWSKPQAPEAWANDWLKLLKCRTQVPCAVYALESEPWRALA
jgi:capsular polysaccharide export protein